MDHYLSNDDILSQFYDWLYIIGCYNCLWVLDFDYIIVILGFIYGIAYVEIDTINSSRTWNQDRFYIS